MSATAEVFKVDNYDFAPWIELSLKPFSTEPCGEDPRYEEEFSVIKHELGNIKGTDYKSLFKACSDILHKKSKDLRVAGYATLAASRLYGINGLASGLAVCCGLFETFAEACHPIKAAQRNNILNWFSEQQKKFARFVESDLDNADDDHILALHNQLRRYQSNFREKIDSSVGSLQDLVKLIDPVAKKIEAQREALRLQQLEQEKADKAMNRDADSNADSADGMQSSMPNNAANPKPNLTVVPNDLNTPSEPAPSLGAVQSDADLLNSARTLIQYFKEKNDFERMVATARAMRWPSQPVPPSENGVTRIPPMRNTALAEIEQYTNREDWLNAFLKAESLFMEPGGHLNFQIQKLASNAAAKMGRKSLSEFINNQLNLFLTKVPEIVHLNFADGEPFASSACLSWLDDIQPDSSTEGSTKQSRWHLLEQQANTLLNEKSLQEALDFINAQGFLNELEQLESRLVAAKLALNGGRPDIAHSLLIFLDSQIEQHQLDKWNPDFAMNVWRFLERSESTTDQDPELASQKSKQIKQRMFRTNPALAAKWF